MLPVRRLLNPGLISSVIKQATVSQPRSSFPILTSSFRFSTSAEGVKVIPSDENGLILSPTCVKKLNELREADPKTVLRILVRDPFPGFDNHSIF